MLGILMPDSAMTMYEHDPVMGLSYKQGGIFKAHANTINSQIMSLLQAYSKIRGDEKKYRSQHIHELKQELHTILDKLDNEERINRFDTLFELYRELRDEIIDAKLESL